MFIFLDRDSRGGILPFESLDRGLAGGLGLQPSRPPFCMLFTIRPLTKPLRTQKEEKRTL
jgi:hypothetical protein